jgi:hypothetical protein
MRTRQVVALSLAALTASVVVPASAGASTTSSAAKTPAVWNYIWKPGTKLPKLPPNETLFAWPAQSAMRHLKVGQRVPTVVIGHTTKAGKYVRAATSRQIASVTNSATGLVNVTREPARARCEKPLYRAGPFTKWTTVGTTFSTVGPVEQTMTYGKGQSSSLSVGYSKSGKIGSFHIQGTASVSSDSKQDMPTNKKGHERYYTEFVYAKYKVPCGITQTTYYEVKAYEWAGGDKLTHPKPVPKAKFCVVETNPGIKPLTFTKDTTTAFTFAAGFEVYGFTGEATTGYDTNASVSFTDPPGYNYHLCGAKDYPGGNHVPKVLVAKH